MKCLFLLLSLITSSAFSQGISPDEKVFDYPPFRNCGLVTRWASNSIPPECLTEALNVYFDEDLSVYRRRGTSQYNATPCTDSKAIKGIWNYDAGSGERYIVIFSSQSFFYTKNQGDCNPIVGLSNLNVTAEFECVQGLGELYCTNGIDTPFSTTVTTFTYLTGMIANSINGTKIGTFRNRIVVANSATQLSRILLSGEGNGNDWTIKIPGVSTTPASIDISGLNDGKPITALMGQYQNAFYIGRNDDLWGLYGNDRRDFTLRQISSQVGITESRSVREKDNCLYWLSRRGVEKMCGTTIERASDPVRPLVDTIIQSAGNTRTKTYDSQVQWETGLYDADLAGQGPLSTTIYPGSIVPSTWSHIDNDGADWGNGTLVDISTTQTSDNMELTFSTTTELVDLFTDNDYTLSPTWTKIGGTGFTIYQSGSLQVVAPAGNNIYFYTSKYNSNMGSWYFRCLPSNSISGTTKTRFRHYFISTTSNPYTTSGYYLESSWTSPGITLNRVDNGITTQIGNSYTDDWGQYFIIDRDINGEFNVYSGTSRTFPIITVTDTVYFTSSTYIIIDCTTLVGTGGCTWDNIYSSSGGYKSSGTFTSPVFDTSFSTPVGGPFTFSNTIPSGSTIVYRVADSTATIGTFTWQTVSTTTSGAYRIPLTKRYWKYDTTLSTQYSTQTPSIEMVGLEATTTGYYIGDCVNATGITSWGNFKPTTNLTGASAISYWISTGTNCNEVTRSTVNWIVQLPNAPVATSTVPYLGFRVFESPVTTTDSLRLNGITWDWNEGTSRPPLASIVYRDRLYIFFSTDTASGAKNDHALVLDMNDKWSLLDDIYVYSATIYESQMYTGDSRNSGLLNIQDIGTDDMGTDYTFRIKTSDYDLGNPVELKKLKRVYLSLKSEETPGQNIDLTLKYYIDGSTTSYSLSSVGLEEAKETGYFIAKFPAINSQPTTFHWISFSLQYDGRQGPIHLNNIKMIYSPIRFE